MAVGLDSRRTAAIARQPILDNKGRIFAYQLLYNCGPAPLDTIDTAAARALTDAVLSIGLEPLGAGRPLFISLTRPLLLGGAGWLLPPSTVVGIHESVKPDADVIGACRELRGRGYSLAVVQAGPTATTPELLSLADYAQVDLKRTKPVDWKPVASQLISRGIQPIGERLDNAEAAAGAVEAGFRLLRGHYFCRPATFVAGQIPSRRMASLKLLAALNRENVSVNEVETLVAHDLALCYRVLRAVNSAAFGIQHEVISIRDALLLLGLAQVRKWASVWAMAGLAEGDPSGLVALSLVRARCCEYLAELMPHRTDNGYFLLGLCSLLDVILKRPMHAAIDDLPLPPEARDALLGRENLARTVLDTVLHYERGDWEAAHASADRLTVNADLLADIYADAIRWAHDLGEFAAAA
jgi:c-di-GMP-related signal transduction protein